MAKTKTVSLRKPNGMVVAIVGVRNDAIEPDVIERDGLVYVRKTHDVYHEATRLVIGNAPAAA